MAFPVQEKMALNKTGGSSAACLVHNLFFFIHDQEDQLSPQDHTRR